MRMLVALVAALAVTITAAYTQDVTPPIPPTVERPPSPDGGATRGNSRVCPTCGQRLRQVAAGWRRTFRAIAEDLEIAAADEGADSRLAGMLARAVRIMEADAESGNKLHEWLDPKFMDYPGCRAPYHRVADILTSREVTAGLPASVAEAYAKFGKLLLDDSVSLDLSLPSDAGEWTSGEQVIRRAECDHPENTFPARPGNAADKSSAGAGPGGPASPSSGLFLTWRHITMLSNLPRTTPEIHDFAVRVATTCRIVVQAMLPPSLWPVAEQKFYLSVRGHLEQVPEDHPEPLVNTRS